MNPERLPKLTDREKSGERLRPKPSLGSTETLLFELTPVQFKTLQEASPNDPKLVELMNAKRISYDMGNVVIEVAGKRKTITTAKEDFGTEVEASGN